MARFISALKNQVFSRPRDKTQNQKNFTKHRKRLEISERVCLEDFSSSFKESIAKKALTQYVFSYIFCGQIAQTVEQRTENPCVAGSIPVLATSSLLNILLLIIFLD